MGKSTLVLLIILSSLTLTAGHSRAQPTNLGRLCFITDAEDDMACSFLYKLQFTYMGNVHVAVTGWGEFLPSTCSTFAFTGFTQPVHGAAQINGSVVEMTLTKSTYLAASGLSPTPQQIRSTTMTVLVNGATGDGSYHQVRKTRLITGEEDTLHYTTGTFDVVACP